MTAPQPERSTRPAPEVIGVMLAAMIYAVVGVGIIVASTVPGDVPTPSPTGSAAVSTPRPAEETINPSLVTLVRETNVRILALGTELEALLVLDPFVTGDVISKVKEISAAATFGKGIVDRIAIQPGGDAIAPPLRDAYNRIVAAADTALSVPFADRVAVRRGAEAVVAALVGLPDIDALLAAVEGTPAPSAPVPTASAECGGDVDSDTDPDRDADTDPAADADGRTDRWRVVDPVAVGTAERPEPAHERRLRDRPRAVGSRARARRGRHPRADHDRAVRRQGVGGRDRSRRGAGAPSAASVEQGGLTLESGRTYVVSLAVRSTAAREIRIRLDDRSWRGHRQPGPAGHLVVDHCVVPGDAHRTVPGCDDPSRSRCVQSTNLAGRGIPGLTGSAPRCIVG